MAQEWIRLDDLLVTVQASIARAAQRTTERPGDIQYVVGECNIAFPAEMQVEGENTLARFPPPVESEAPPVPESQLARISFSLRPTIARDSEA